VKKIQWLRRLLRHVLVLVGLALLGAFFAATLVRYSPGYGADERELDPRLSPTSVEAIRKQHRLDSNLFRYYGEYLSAAARGDFGTSESLQRPVIELVKERFPVTAHSVLFGVVTAWTMALALAVIGLLFCGWIFEVSSTLLSGLLLALPSAVIALLFVHLRAPVFLAIAMVTFPKLFRFIRNLLAHAYDQPHVLAARARGIGPVRIFLCHVIPLAAPPLVALLGVSVSIAFGAAVPIEALCDSAGIGQLAWTAALNRDLPLVMNLTVIVTLITVACNSVAAYSSQVIARET
jgi:peptide/nickel transport system permease protein